MRIDPELHAALRDGARSSGVSLNDYCARKLVWPRSALPAPAAEVVKRALSLFGHELAGVIAFGSWARDELAEDSDVDVLVVVEAGVSIARESQGGDPIRMSQRELIQQNPPEAIEERLARKGVSTETARAAARATATEGAALRIEELAASRDDMLALERTIGGTNDLVDVRFLLRAAEQSASVGRIRLPRGFATGFLVAPSVLMTNWHVFQTRASAQGSRVEFGFRELDFGGRLSTPTVFAIDPDTLFFSNREHDVSLVAMGSRLSGELRIEELPILRLTPGANAVIRGERVNIIQHPGGEPKQVALRDNTVFEIDNPFLQYRADTQRGSSGSPVFNDEWDLVALHHSGVPREDEDGNWLAVDGSIWEPSMGDHRIDWIANEGILASALHALLSSQNFLDSEQRLIDQILEGPGRPESLARQSVSRLIHSGKRPQVELDHDFRGVAEVTVPVTISVRLGEDTAPVASMRPAAERVSNLLERFSIDRDYSSRRGYSSDFLAAELPRPGLSAEQLAVAARNREANEGDDVFELPYHNFSVVVMNGERRLAFYTAVNIDGHKLIRITRDQDGGEAEWITDKRIGMHEQADNRFYRGRRNRLDRGHMVRRLDPAWGESEADSARGILDTFHYTNSTPQYDSFNRGGTGRRRPEDRLWLALEDFVLDNAESEGLRITVLVGPVFRKEDPDFQDNGLKIPQEFWKIVAWCDQREKLHAAAFLLSQKRFLDADRDIELVEAFDFRDRELFQSDVATIAGLTGLDFGPLLEASESEVARESTARGKGRRIEALGDVELA